MFFQLFSDHKEIMEAIGDLNGTTEQRDYVLSLFYKLLANPTFQLKFYFKFFKSDVLVFNVIGYSLAITAPDHVEKQKTVWQKVLDLDSPILSIIKPWTIIENIYWNYTCALISIKQIIRGDISISSSLQIDGIRVLINTKNQFRHRAIRIVVLSFIQAVVIIYLLDFFDPKFIPFFYIYLIGFFFISIGYSRKIFSAQGQLLKEHVPIVLGSVLTEKGSSDKKERVLEIKNTLFK